MYQLVLVFAWSWICVGLISGTLIGLRFHQHDWLGGYDDWRRRMIRLGHIAFLGTGLLNLGALLSFRYLNFETMPTISAVSFMIGAISMPTVCFLSAYRKSFRHLFAIPVIGLVTGAVSTLIEVCRAI